MNNNNSTGISYLAGFFILVGLALIGFMISGFLGGLVLIAHSGMNLGNMKEVMNNPANAPVLRWIQIVSVVISFFIPSVAVARMISRKPFKLLGFGKEADIGS